MIDCYYEFHEGSKLFDQPIRFAFIRGYHPKDATTGMKILYNTCYQMSIRMWIENANGLVLAKEHGLDVHKKCDPKELTWLKLQAREL